MYVRMYVCIVCTYACTYTKLKRNETQNFIIVFYDWYVCIMNNYGIIKKYLTIMEGRENLVNGQNFPIQVF